MQETIVKFLASMESEGRVSTVPTYRRALERYDSWLTAEDIAVLSATTEDIIAFQEYLAESYRRPDTHKALVKGTQVTWLCAVKSFYTWCYRRGLVLNDPAAAVKLPRIVRRRVVCDPLSQQEAIALVQTQAAIVAAKRKGSYSWAIETRNLAMVCMGLSTGRRCSSIGNLRVTDLDHERCEVRIEWEKGRPGRVLPCAAWALAVAKQYVEEARPVLLAVGGHKRADPGWLFMGVRTKQVDITYLTRLVHALQTKTVEANPDLDEMAAKKLTSHSLRVTFATLMFLNGAGIRIVNDLLLHKHLQTTARYTPLHLDDLRRACRLAHPRA